MTDLAAEARAAAEQLFAWAKDRNFEGYDPYDALNSPIVRAAAFGTRWGRIAWTQLLRRSPVNLRPPARNQTGRESESARALSRIERKTWRQSGRGIARRPARGAALAKRARRRLGI